MSLRRHFRQRLGGRDRDTAIRIRRREPWRLGYHLSTRAFEPALVRVLGVMGAERVAASGALEGRGPAGDEVDYGGEELIGGRPGTFRACGLRALLASFVHGRQMLRRPVAGDHWPAGPSWWKQRAGRLRLGRPRCIRTCGYCPLVPPRSRYLRSKGDFSPK
jgi:hypothetical protein